MQYNQRRLVIITETGKTHIQEGDETGEIETGTLGQFLGL